MALKTWLQNNQKKTTNNTPHSEYHKNIHTKQNWQIKLKKDYNESH